MSDLAEGTRRLIEEAKKNPDLLHALVFDTEKAIASLDYLNRRQKASMLSLRPEDVMAGLVGSIINPGGSVEFCGSSCSDSCTNTCGAGSCDGTCASSCTNTCGSISCGDTTSIVNDRFAQVAQFERFNELHGGAFFRRFRR